MIEVTKTYIPSLSEYSSYLEKIWETGQITNNGPLCKKLSQNVANYLGISSLELVSNGTLALQLAIKALDLKGEIITTPFSYVATANAIAWEGCQPVFVDIEDRTFCINPELIEDAITDRTSAILATHVYGYPCDVERIKTIAAKYNLKVIYDAAHCFGVKLNGQTLLSHGDISVLSFHATKLFHSAEGGAVVCNNQVILNRIALMKKFGHMGEESYLSIGINAKMSELHAAMGLCVLPNVADIIDKRRISTEHYNKAFNNVAIERPKIPAGIDYNFAYYPIVFSKPEEMQRVRNALIENEIMPRRYFYPSLNKLDHLHRGRNIGCKISEGISERVLSLPLSHILTSSDIERISNIIIKALK